MVLFKKYSCTGLGCLPNTKSSEAINLVEKYFQEIPFLPQFPLLDKFESLGLQFIESLLCLKKENSGFVFERDIFKTLSFLSEYNSIIGDETRLNEYGIKHISALESFIDLLEKLSPNYAKAQVTGPLTLSLMYNESCGKKAYYFEDLRQIIMRHVVLKALWLANKIKSKGVKPIIFLDEPLLSMFGKFSDMERKDVVTLLSFVVKNLKKLGIIVGLHCCDNCNWSVVYDCDFDIWSFNAVNYFNEISQYSLNIEKFLDKGGILAWGIVPTSSNKIVEKTSVDKLYLDYFVKVNLLASKGIKREKILESSIITPLCNMENLSESMSQKVLELTNLLSGKLRE